MANEEFKRALEASREIELTVTGRKSGREISLPVWFVRDGEKLYLVPVRGSDTNWYKNVRKMPTVRLAAGGSQLTATVTPVWDRSRGTRLSTSSGPSTALEMCRRTTPSTMSRWRFRSTKRSA
jgi:deazaflavin-dependent oxidoreductase (nitroreductase family)